MLQLQAREKYGLAALGLILAAMVVYFGVVFPRDGSSIFPWSSDAWGHLIKAVYLREQIGEGNWYPDIFPAWYNGQQMLRYFPPVSYYMLVGLNEITGNIFSAGNLFMFATAVIGSLSFLLFAPRIGLFWAVVAGFLFIIFPDNLRVAFAEGNLPRIAATAFLPAAMYFLMNMLDRGARKRDFIGLTAALTLIILSHAMMAAIFMFGLGLYAVSYYMVTGKGFKTTALTIGTLANGLFLSAWWLFPSLTGGINELDNNAASEAIAEFPASIALNPGLRSGDNEVFYVGISLVALMLFAFFRWKRYPDWARALLPAVLIMTIIGTTMFVDAWRVLPAHQLAWPIRFMSFAGVGLILVGVVVAADIYKAGNPFHTRWLRFAAIAVVGLIIVDFQPSMQLVRGRERPVAVQQIADRLEDLDGWRVATADLSRLGSAPAMLFTTEGGREQVFGWAFQGSITAPSLARINEAITEGNLEYAVSRLDRMGADDIVILPQVGISPGFTTELEDQGYALQATAGGLLLFHRDGAPRAYEIPMRVLGVGTGANNAALIFPEISVVSSSNIEDYPLEFLAQYDVVLLSRFTVSSRSSAEKLVRALAETGTTVIIDMTSAPTSPLSRQPKFLGVYGEPVLHISRATLIEDGARSALLPFDGGEGPWRSVTPQGAEEDLILFQYPAATGSALSRNRYGDGEVLFLGLNLIFHATETGDPRAIQVLEQITGLTAATSPADRRIPLTGYDAGEDGWRFDITLPEAGWILFPFAHHDGTRVTVNGQEVDTFGMEKLAFARMPAGASSVHIGYVRTLEYAIGIVLTIVGLVAAAAFLLTGSRLSRRLNKRFLRSGQDGAHTGLPAGTA